MKKILTTLAITAASLTVAAAPASAQWGNQRGGYNQQHYGYPGDRGMVNRFNQQISQLEQRIERSAQRRAISPGEYRSLRNQAHSLRRTLYSFSRNGLSRNEVRSMDHRIHNLRNRIRDERRDGRRRGW